MKVWRIGSFSMGLFLVLLGVTFLVGQFNPPVSQIMIRNWWPLLLISLGVEVLLTNYLRIKGEAKFSYDFLSIIFIALISMISLGFYFLQTIGITERIQEVISGRTYPVSHQLDLIPNKPVTKVILDTNNLGWTPIRIWDSTDNQVHVKIHGRIYALKKPVDPASELAAMGTMEQMNQAVYIRLEGRSEHAPWYRHPDQIDLIIPANLILEYSNHSNLKASEFHGKIISPEK